MLENVVEDTRIRVHDVVARSTDRVELTAEESRTCGDKTIKNGIIKYTRERAKRGQQPFLFFPSLPTPTNS